MEHVSCLRVPTTFFDALPLNARKDARYRVAWLQYHILLGVTALRGELPIPPRAPQQATPASTSVSPWFGKLRARKVHPNPTNKNLDEQVHYQTVKHKRRPTQRALPAKDPGDRDLRQSP